MEAQLACITMLLDAHPRLIDVCSRRGQCALVIAIRLGRSPPVIELLLSRSNFLYGALPEADGAEEHDGELAVDRRFVWTGECTESGPVLLLTRCAACMSSRR